MVILAGLPLDTPAASISSSSITPGIAGFLITFGIALVCWVLFRSMTRHIRKIKHAAAAQAAPHGQTPPQDEPKET